MSSAILSPCGTYRYVLTRDIPCMLRWVKPCLFVMLNPSTADASMDDPTIRRCKGFAQAWSCTSLTVVNLFGLRATNPKELRTHLDPYGPDNGKHLADQIAKHRVGVVVAAWGANPCASLAAASLLFNLKHYGAIAKCLGKTKDGSPRHPLYVRADAQLEEL